MTNDLQIIHGDTTTLAVTVTDSLGAPYDLTGCTVHMGAKLAVTDTAYVFQTDSSTGSITIDIPESGGTAVAKILPSYTAAIPQVVTKLAWGMQVVNGGDVFTIATGTLVVVPVVGIGGA